MHSSLGSRLWTAPMAETRACPNFFLSHTLKDKPLVLRIHRALTALGLPVWVDKFEIRPGDSLIQKVFNDGLQRSDIVCAFITEHSQTSAWVREELDSAFNRSIPEGRPRIIVLRFDGAEVPFALRHRRYETCDRHEIGDVVRKILFGAGLEGLQSEERQAEPLATLDYHDVVRMGDEEILLASRRDSLDVEPFADGEGVIFHRRHIFVVGFDRATGRSTAHHLTTARMAHSAMRIMGEELIVFLNEKAEDRTFAMEGRLFRLRRRTLRPTSVQPVFMGRNWGWSPLIDETGAVHHGDSETPGNPYMVGTQPIAGKTWSDLAPLIKGLRRDHSRFDEAGEGDRRTGYLRFIDVPPNAFSS